MKVPRGWDRIEATRSTPHGEYEVTVYADTGKAYAQRWVEGTAVPVQDVGAFEDGKAAFAAVESEIKRLNKACPHCGQEKRGER